MKIRRLTISIVFMCGFLIVMTLGVSNTFAGQESLLPIRVTTEIGPASLTVWIANLKGFFAENGLKADIKIFDTAALGLQAIGAGEADISLQAAPPTAILISKGVPAKVIAVESQGPEMFKVVVKQEIANSRQLAGKKIAVTKGTGGEYFFMKWLEQNGIRSNEVKIIYVAPAESVPLLVKGSIDGIGTWEPWPGKALELDKSLHVLGTNKGMPIGHMYFAVRNNFMKDHPEGAQNFLKAMQAAISFKKSNPKETLSIFKSLTRTSENLAKDLIDSYVHELRWNALCEQELMEVAKFNKEAGKIENIPDWKTIINLKPLKEVCPECIR